MEKLNFLLSKTIKKEGCLELHGNSVNGYNRSTHNKKSWYTHRLVWTLIHGEIEKGKVICHKCDNTRCINPDHLFIGTQSDNLMDKIKKGRCPIKAKTHCKRGHIFDYANTHIRANGRRLCRACYRVYRKNNIHRSRMEDSIEER